MKGILITIAVIMTLGGLLYESGYWENHAKTECVKDKWIKGLGGQGQKYLIGMESGDVYQLKNSVVKWNWRGSDLYLKFTEGECYDIEYYGWRLGFFSTYKIIDSVQEVQNQ